MRLNGYEIGGHDLVVSGNLRIESESSAGQTSSTERSFKGFKPKTLNCNLLIKYSESSDLTDLIELAEGLDSNGKQTVYRVVDPLANALKIRQVRFTDNFSCNKNDGSKSWKVSFTLVEYLSVAEKIETRKEPPPVVEQTAEGNTVAAVDNTQIQAEPQEVSLTERIFTYLDEALA